MPLNQVFLRSQKWSRLKPTAIKVKRDKLKRTNGAKFAVFRWISLILQIFAFPENHSLSEAQIFTGNRRFLQKPVCPVPRGRCDRKNSIPIENFNPAVFLLTAPSWCYREGLDRKLQSTMDRLNVQSRRRPRSTFFDPWASGFSLSL